ncbi:hypothetical protein Q7P35_006708 [Cladosporium inversicolor]
MHDTYAGHKNAADFVAEDGHVFVEIWRQRWRIKARQDQYLAEEAVIETNTKDRTCSFRLLISKPVDSVFPGRRRYPLTLEAIGQILEAFNIPLPFINIMAAHATVAMDYDAVQDFQLPATAPSKRTGIIFVLGPIALATSYSIVTKMTTGVVLGLCNHQTSRLISLVENIAEVSQVPTMLPLILVNVLSETRAHRVLGRKQAINRLEESRGRHTTAHGVRSEVAWDLHAIEAQLEMITLVAGVQDSINEQDNTVDEQSPAMVAFQARARRARQTLSGLIHWTHYNQQRIQIQLQTIYNLTSQRDNDLSYRTAVASQKIAEATQRDGVLMKQLAAQSKALALRTWRDGVDMRAMAVINLITLPGTFTATLFSTSFFNFEPATSGKHVSPWIWLYFVVTAAFTALCLFGWYYSSQTMAQAAQKTPMDGEMHEGEKMQDSDSRMHSSHESRIEDIKDTEDSSPPSLRSPTERLSVDQSANPSSRPVATTTADPTNTSSNSSRTQPASNVVDTAKARAHWDASDVWGTQSYGESRKACAMCAQHVE